MTVVGLAVVPPPGLSEAQGSFLPSEYVNREQNHTEAQTHPAPLAPHGASLRKRSTPLESDLLRDLAWPSRTDGLDGAITLLLALMIAPAICKTRHLWPSRQNIRGIEPKPTLR